MLSIIDSDANRECVDYYIDFLSFMKTPDDFGEAIFRSDQQWGAGYGQMFGPMMKKLYYSDSEVRAKVHAHLNRPGICDEWIAGYFEKHVHGGSFRINLFMSYIPEDKREIFAKESDQLILDILKEYSGLLEES